MLKKSRSYVFSACEYISPPQRSFYFKNENLKFLMSNNYKKRSQDLKKIYHDAGQFYWGTSESWLEGRALFSKNTMPYILPRHRVQDIDTMEDWKRAELMFKALKDE